MKKDFAKIPSSAAEIGGKSESLKPIEDGNWASLKHSKT